MEQPIKRGRGRPRKNEVRQKSLSSSSSPVLEQPIKRGRGRPRKDNKGAPLAKHGRVTKVKFPRQRSAPTTMDVSRSGQIAQSAFNPTSPVTPVNDFCQNQPPLPVTRRGRGRPRKYPIVCENGKSDESTSNQLIPSHNAPTTLTPTAVVTRNEPVGPEEAPPTTNPPKPSVQVQEKTRAETRTFGTQTPTTAPVQQPEGPHPCPLTAEAFCTRCPAPDHMVPSPLCSAFLMPTAILTSERAANGETLYLAQCTNAFPYMWVDARFIQDHYPELVERFLRVARFNSSEGGGSSPGSDDSVIS